MVHAIYNAAEAALGHGFFALVTPGVCYDGWELWRQCPTSYLEMKEIARRFWFSLGFVRDGDSEMWVIRVGDE